MGVALLLLLLLVGVVVSVVLLLLLLVLVLVLVLGELRVVAMALLVRKVQHGVRVTGLEGGRRHQS